MRTTLTYFLTLFFLLALSAIAVQPTEAQALRRLKDRAKEKVEKKAGEKMDKAIDNAVDGKPAESDEHEPAGGAAGDAAAPSEATAEAPGEAAALNPGQGAWANYDFVPGERILFAEDFTTDRVGNFPHRFEFISGNGEIVEWEGRRWLRLNDETYFRIPIPENLPERFTVEFDVTIPWWGMDFHSDDYTEDRYNPNTFTTSAVILGCCEAGVYRGQGASVSSVDPRNFFKDMFNEDGLSLPMRVRLHVDGSYTKLYLNEKRVANMPNGNWGRHDYLSFRMRGSANEAEAPLITGFSINAGGTPMYDALMAEGRFSTQGIFFDTGSDRIRPESTPTLKEIGDMLEMYADLRLLIEGHTDNVGTAESNQDLSERRAAAVRDFLITTYSIDGSRLEAQGFGAGMPSASNDTPEGRQQNRRVELVKL